MDGLFVNTNNVPFEYLFVEAKCSILPTEKTPFKAHKHGILKDMISSLNSYHNNDPRFELSRIRDNLEKSFSSSDASKIRGDLTPPGPENMRFLGVSVTNASTIKTDDDDFILSIACDLNFNYYAIAVTNLATLSKDAYGRWFATKAAMA